MPRRHAVAGSEAIAAAFCCLTVSTAAAPAAARPVAGGAAVTMRRPPKPQPGDALRVFDNARLLVVTNADHALADALLEGCRQRERRFATPEEWRKLPGDIYRFATVVFLIDRERLAAGESLPQNCPAERDELYVEAIRHGSQAGVNHEVILSAPDSAWLKQAVADFRKRAEVPRRAEKRNVRSLAVIPSGPGAAVAAAPLLASDGASSRRAHLLPVEHAAPTEVRRLDMDEVILIDRSAEPTAEAAPLLASLTAGRTVGRNDTVIWKEARGAGAATGRSRVVISAPTADLLGAALRRYPDPLNAPETPTVVVSARDLRSVRRVAVATVKNDVGSPELARRLASKAATDLRALDAFEVLERSGLSEVLGEVALGQAGITKSVDRAKVRQMAAADALLIIEVTGVNARTAYDAAHERITPKMGGAPRRPLEPSRLKYSITIPGKENDPVVRTITDSLLSRSVGTKSDRQYKDDLNRYHREVLPAWQRERDSYEDARRTRPVQWKQNLTARTGVSVTGSLRLVDLTDGLVLWEAPFNASARADIPRESRTVTTYGDDSNPDASDVPPATDDAPPVLLEQAADEALTQGIQALKGSALLPTTSLLAEAPPDGGAAPAAGRLLDVDGGTLLIGLGAGDGVKLGGTLLLTLPDGQTARLVVTRVRPRTCDAVFDKSVSLSQRARAVAGQSVTLAAAPVAGAVADGRAGDVKENR